MSTESHGETMDKDVLLFDYATGALPEGPSLAVAAHLTLDREARARYRAMEAAGGALLAGMAPEPVSDRLLDETLSRLDEAELEMRAPMPDLETRLLLPRPLWRYVPDGLGALRWKSWGKTVREAMLPLAERGHRATLISIRAGAGVMRHTHGGTEYTVVLAGGFRDESGHYGPGALQICDGSVTHVPVADPGADCLCLGVLSAPLRFTGLIGQLVNPMVRF